MAKDKKLTVLTDALRLSRLQTTELKATLRDLWKRNTELQDKIKELLSSKGQKDATGN